MAGVALSRRLRVVEAGPELIDEVRAALAGGDALLPIPPGAPNPTNLPDTVPQRVALVVETSGSSGAPKRVALSADALLANTAASESALGGPGQWVLALPTHYIAGLNVLIRSIAAETVPIAVEGEHFTAGSFVAAVELLGPLDRGAPARFVSLVPAQLSTLLDDPDARSALRGFARVLVGGQATPRAVLDRAREAGLTVSRSYGSSETSGGCVYDGEPIGSTAVRIQHGEVWLGGPGIADGYLGDEALTAERFVEEGGVRWFRTADAGEFVDGTLRVSGRRDDVIISGGVKVSLGRVEQVIREHPGLADAVVVPVSSERWGEASVVVTAADPDAVDAASAIAEVAAEMGAAARPSRVLRVDPFPLLPSGKPDRVALRALAEERPDSTA